MRYVSIDIETTGVDRQLCQILEIGVYIEDSNFLQPLENLPCFRALFKNEVLYWEDMAYKMHKKSGLLEELENTPPEQLLTGEEVVEQLAAFLLENGFKKEDKGRICFVAAGKNFGTFDRVFLENIPTWRTTFKIPQRVLDPTLFYVDFRNDQEPPSMEVCKERAGIIDTATTHRAGQDALDVVQLLRVVYNS